MATIITKNSSTASSVPTNAQLVQGELAVNVTDKRLFTENASGTVVELGTNPSSLTLPNGVANGVPYLNGSKVLTTGSALTFNGTTFGVSGNQTVSGADGLFVSGAISGSSPFITGGNLELGATASSALIQAYNRPSFGAYNLDLKTTTAFTFSLAGSEQMRLTSTGLGIGTSSPSTALDVASASGSPIISLTASGAWRYQILTDRSSKTFRIRDQSAGDLDRVILDQSGNLGLGVTPSAWGSNSRALQVFTYSALYDFSSGYNGLAGNARHDGSTWRYIASNRAISYEQSVAEGSHKWFTAPSGTAGNAISFTQAMTLDASGNLLVGTTSGSQRLVVAQSGTANTFDFSTSNTSTDTVGVLYRPNDGAMLRFNRGGSLVGSITVTALVTTYNTSSDYRLKDNIAPMTGALAKVAALKPCTYKWKADGSDGEGFIAHELAEVVPQCVTGEKDAVDEEGNPIYQGIDTSFLVATLTAAIQELKVSLDEVKLEFDAYKAAHP